MRRIKSQEKVDMKRILYFLLLIIFTLFTGRAKLQPQSTITNTYNGRSLSVGIIGEIPKVREKQVNFIEIEFSDLEKDTLDSKYDAVFITKNNLQEASEERYSLIYKKSKIPFFFIQSEKSHIPFTIEEISYEEAPDVNDLNYATGIIYKNDNFESWGYGLYRDIENEANIKDVYSRIFETISENTILK